LSLSSGKGVTRQLHFGSKTVLKVTATDYQGPVELLGILSAKNRERALAGVSGTLPDLNIEFTYLSHTLDPVEPTAGPNLLPSLTYDDAKEQFDIILVPGGNII
jgi:putative intracellular protease/amidase